MAGGRSRVAAGLPAAVGTVDRLDVIHVHSSLARRGARVTGLDFSGVALARAEELAGRTEVDVSWVRADAARIPADLHRRSDLAYARFSERGSYAGAGAEFPSSEAVNFAHSLGETLTAAIDAGLRIDSLTEHVETSKSPRLPMVPREAGGRHRLRLDGQSLPILFTLLATKPRAMKWPLVAHGSASFC